MSIEHVSPPPVPSPPVFHNGNAAGSRRFNNGRADDVNPNLTLPFHAVSILSRPSNGDRENKVPVDAHRIHSSDSRTKGRAQSKQSPERPFQPQILRRPQPGSSVHSEGPDSTSITPPIFPKPTLERRPAQPTEHKQALLSLFGKAPSATSVPLRTLSKDGPSPNPPTEATSADVRSRVGSLASGNDESSSRRGSQPPISPADKGFLLNYLGAMANRGY